VLDGAKEVLSGGCDTLLLPYCAKPLWCDYRKKDGCAKCGGCSIGEAYEIAERAGLSVVTVQNFEHLKETLENLRKKGSKGFIGCCCEGFYYKHQDDFNQYRIPGILIDIDNKTCYDLGKDGEAYQGNFESQTRLRINPLQKLVNYIQKKNQNV